MDVNYILLQHNYLVETKMLTKGVNGVMDYVLMCNVSISISVMKYKPFKKIRILLSLKLA